MTESEDAHMEQSGGRARVIISGVEPEIDSGLFPTNDRRVSSGSNGKFVENRILTATCREAGLKCST